MLQAARNPGSPTYCGNHCGCHRYKEEESAVFDTLVTGMVETTGLGTWLLRSQQTHRLEDCFNTAGKIAQK